jgi:hypothetical protein
MFAAIRLGRREAAGGRARSKLRSVDNSHLIACPDLVIRHQCAVGSIRLGVDLG